ncbi:hypothetical protein [Bradyrhizobium valentinum]|uniref:Uncharacterized protein n=1 Tax=Bradyrhizobium valentinum TaxID=1518501 RepID=A0A0R3LS70_9BRAD|nr:hypothetical protein [Bradyrhizobium valentinum]KRR10754.1 hypothetical protein CP49_32310 [Bradyrhizobium valentinum]KRR11174.1 hypothetical protein CQ10_11940 [Bradyrhizobium valentinum]
MTKTMTIVALICFLVVGAAATAILGRDSVPAAQPQLASAPAAAVQTPVSNKESKKDRLAVVSYAAAAYEPPQTTAALSEPLRQAYASTAPVDIGLPKEVAPPAAAQAAPQAKPKAVAKPQPQKNYALLSDVQIAGIKDRLKLSASQESYWPPVETALRAVARKIHAGRQANPNATGVPIDPESAEVQQLKSAAMPLLFQLREDQKSEVRTLARIIGLEKVAAMI